MKINNWALALSLCSLCVISTEVLAQATAADMMTNVGQTIETWMVVAIRILSAVAFFVVGYGVLSKFIDAINGRSTWGEVIVPVIFGVVVLVATGYFFTQATTLAEAIAA